MDNLNLISPEIFLSLSILFLLIFGVFKKNSSNIIYILSICSLIITNIPKIEQRIKIGYSITKISNSFKYLEDIIKTKIPPKRVIIFI